MSSLRGPIRSSISALRLTASRASAISSAALRGIQLLPADAAAGGTLGQRAHPGELRARIVGISRRRSDVCLRLGDLLGPIAMMQPRHDFGLHRDSASAFASCAARRLVSSRART